MSIDTHHASPSRAIIGPTPPAICPDTLALLPSLTEDAGSGRAQGLAVVAPRDGVACHLKVRESAREEGNPMAMVGMPTTLKQSNLEAH